MAKLSEMFPSNYIKASDFDDDQDTIVTISEIKPELVGQGKDAETKFVLYFDGYKKGLILNKTNAKTVGNLYGDDSDGWEGTAILQKKHLLALCSAAAKSSSD